MTLYNGTYNLSQLLQIFRTEFSAFDNFTMIDNNYDSRDAFVVKYNPEDLYIDFWRTGVQLTAGNPRYDPAYRNGLYIRYQNSAYATGICIDTYSAYNATTHTGSGSKGRYFIPSYVEYQQGVDVLYSGDTKTINVQMWIDKYGFLGATQNSINPGRPQAVGTVFMCEFVSASHREFDDGLSNMFFHSEHNYMHDQGTPNENDANYYTLNGRGTSWQYQVDLLDQGKIKYAYKSGINSKVYFQFPYWFKDQSMNKPVYRTKRWFYFNVNEGVVTNDVISWLDLETSTVRKFLCIEAACQTTTSKIYVAIPYENPALYG